MRFGRRTSGVLSAKCRSSGNGSSLASARPHAVPLASAAPPRDRCVRTDAQPERRAEVFGSRIRLPYELRLLLGFLRQLGVRRKPLAGGRATRATWQRAAASRMVTAGAIGLHEPTRKRADAGFFDPSSECARSPVLPSEHDAGCWFGPGEGRSCLSTRNSASSRQSWLWPLARRCSYRPCAPQKLTSLFGGTSTSRRRIAQRPS